MPVLIQTAADIGFGLFRWIRPSTLAIRIDDVPNRHLLGSTSCN